MSVNKKYYYMRLKENFFDTDEMILLESMPDGILYSNILIKLYLKSLKYEGRLLFRDHIPYNSEMIATVTRHPVGVVEKALETFNQLGLIDILPDNVLYMSDIELMIGKTSTEADRKRLARMKIEQGKLLGLQDENEPNGQMSDKYPPEYRVKSIELEKDNISNASHNQNDLPRKIFDYWNSKGITIHRTLQDNVRNRILTVLNTHGYDEIINVIDNYAEVYSSDEYFFSYKYTLLNLLRNKDLDQFGTEAEPLVKFKRDNKKKEYISPYEQNLMNGRRRRDLN